MLKKLSLAALIAMGSMSVASATPLTEAIKGVDLSGMLRIRFYNDDPEDGQKTDRWRTNGIFIFKVPAGEHIKFVYRASVQTDAKGLRDNGALAHVGALNSNDPVDVGHMNNLLFMAYSNNGLNAMVGKIPVKSPITSADPATPGHGAGAIVSYNVGNGLTVAGGYVDALKHADPFDYENYIGDLITTSLYLGALVYNSDMVDAQAWYFHMPNLIKHEYVVSAKVKALKEYGVTIEANYASSKLDDNEKFNYNGTILDLSNADDTKKYYDITVKYNNAGIHGLVGYANSSDDEGKVTTSVDSPLGGVLPTQQVTNIANYRDMDAWYGMVGYDVTSALNVSARYAHFDASDDDGDADEYVAQVDYKYNKKLSFEAYYSVFDADEEDGDKNELRLQAQYNF